MLAAIKNRRSIRKYQDIAIPEEDIRQILEAGILAPSSKNRQPWEFIVVSGQSKQSMLLAMQQGLSREKNLPLLPNSNCHLAGAEYTLQIMQQAPVTILVVNKLGADIWEALNPEERVYEICNAQSIGAAIQNMTLTATELGLGSLWICDTYFAHQELNAWLNMDGELIAALTIGYAAEQPAARPRAQFDEVVSWRS